MASECKTQYCGYTNYQTWTIQLMINDEANRDIDEYFIRSVNRAWDSHLKVIDDRKAVTSRVTNELAEIIKDRMTKQIMFAWDGTSLAAVMESCPYIEQLIIHMMACINWYELASHYVLDTEPCEPGEKC